MKCERQEFKASLEIYLFERERTLVSEVFLGNGVPKICTKFTGEHRCHCKATLLKSHFDLGVLL